MKTEAGLEAGELQRRIGPLSDQFPEPFEIGHLRPDRLEVFRLQVFRAAFHAVGVVDLVERPLALPRIAVLAADRTGAHRSQLVQFALDPPYPLFDLFHFS